MSRKWHYWSRNTRLMRIRDILYVDTETVATDDSVGSLVERHRLRIGCCVYTRYEGREYRPTRTKEHTFCTPGQFITIMESYTHRKCTLYVCAHNMRFDFAILGLWRYIRSSGVTIRHMMIGSGIFYIEIRVGMRRIRFVDSTSYMQASIASLGQMVGRRKLRMPSLDDGIDEIIRYCMNDVYIMKEAMEAYMRCIADTGVIGVGYTTSATSMIIYRRRFMRSRVLVHDDRDVVRIERSAYYGGLVWFTQVGRRIDGPIYELDICSMYPSVCRYRLPTRILDRISDCDSATLSRLCSRYMVIGRVYVSDSVRMMPKRIDGMTSYCVGEYDTYLATPEIQYLLSCGSIHRAHDVVVYECDDIFREYMEYMVSRKEACKRDGNHIMGNVYKLLANSLYGKTGQRSNHPYLLDDAGISRMMSEYALDESQVDTILDIVYMSESDSVVVPVGDGGRRIHFVRTNLGWFVRSPDVEGYDSVVSIAATVTSYARVMMYQIWDVIGRENVIYTDTDSVWVTRDSYDRLLDLGFVQNGVLGKLQLKCIHDYIIVHGRKDYETDKVKKMKGIRYDAIAVGVDAYQQVQFEGVTAQLRRDVDDSVLIARVIKRLSRKIDRVSISADGIVSPIVLRENRHD